MKYSAAFAIVALPIFAVATPAPAPAPIEARQQFCNTGSIQCCSNVATTNDNGVIGALLDLLGAVVGVNVPVGVTCSPITVGVSGTECTSQTLCCDNDDFGGVIAIGCTPITISL